MNIRRAKLTDYAAVARLHRQTIRYVNSVDYSPEIITAWSARPSARYLRNSAPLSKRWVALEKEKIVGFCSHTLKGKMTMLYVHKNYLGKGYGGRLLNKAEASMKKMGFIESVIESTITAKNFYKKHGYKVIRKNNHVIGGYKIPVYIMKKKLV